jgi:hypothetical protein
MPAVHAHRYSVGSPTNDVTAQASGVAPSAISLFVRGATEELPDEDRLDALGIQNGISVLYMLAATNPGWRWTDCGSTMSLSSDAATGASRRVATKTAVGGWQMATGGERVVAAGRDYFEFVITALRCGSRHCDIYFGAARPGLDHCRGHAETLNAWYISGEDGSLHGPGKRGHCAQGMRFTEGDRIGVMLDLDAGWVRFYRNGRRCGPGFTHGVTGPLVPAVEIIEKGDAVAAAPPRAEDANMLI